jgi:hypothetical protein
VLTGVFNEGIDVLVEGSREALVLEEARVVVVGDAHVARISDGVNDLSTKLFENLYY